MYNVGDEKENADVKNQTKKLGKIHVKETRSKIFDKWAQNRLNNICEAER